MHVLVIDDDEDFCDYISALLKRAEYTVLAIASGEKALAAAKQGCFDAIVTDLCMPEVDGIEIIRAVKAARPETPIIGITGGCRGSVELYLGTMILFGAEAAFVKPLDEAAFLAALGKAIMRHVRPASMPFCSTPAE
jgi:CheY-like chemotaxis protein